MLTKLTGFAAALFMTCLTGLFFYMTVLTGATTPPNDWPAAAMQVFSFVILLGAMLAAATLSSAIWREVWNLFRSPKSPD
jgi:ABC-type transport system involved in multi-copper enzyme maturation permease subunit